MTSRQALRAQQDAYEAIVGEVFDRIGAAAMDDLRERQQMDALKRGLVLDFYRDARGMAQYRFRPETAAEQNERASDWVEDNI